MKAWRVTGWVCSATIIASLIVCVAIALVRSNGLVAVTVTALDPETEPSDPKIPLLKQHESLPDYELTLISDDSQSKYLGVKPDESAASGLTWQLADPVSLSQISAIRLREKDALLSDTLAEVQITDTSVESNGFRFEFETKRSLSVGVQAFFATPIGLAIAGAFALAVLVIILSNFSF